MPKNGLPKMTHILLLKPGFTEFPSFKRRLFNLELIWTFVKMIKTINASFLNACGWTPDKFVIKDPLSFFLCCLLNVRV